MSGSSDDHLRRGGDRPDEMGDIFRTLSSQQLNVLYGVLTNNSRRTVFMDQLQDIVVANADSVVRGGPPRKAMPKNTAKESTILRPRGPSTAPRPYRPPRPSVATLVTSPPPPPHPPKSPPSSDDPRPSGLNSVKAFCAKAVGDAVPKGIPRCNSRSRSRSRSRSLSAESVY